MTAVFLPSPNLGDIGVEEEEEREIIPLTEPAPERGPVREPERVPA